MNLKYPYSQAQCISLLYRISRPHMLLVEQHQNPDFKSSICTFYLYVHTLTKDNRDVLFVVREWLKVCGWSLNHWMCSLSPHCWQALLWL